VDLNAAGTSEVGAFLQVEAEILRIEEVLNNGSRYRVTRGLDNTVSAHAAQALVYQLRRKSVVVPYARDFFGSSFSGDWSYPVDLPNARVSAAELFVTNSRGNSETSVIALTGTVDKGLRTLAGGQFSIQVDGFLAIEMDATPELVVDAPHSVRDVFAVVKTPADGPIELLLKRNGTGYCSLTIYGGETMSNIVNGFGLAPLESGARIGLDIVTVGQTNPGADLTVIMRL
jgi:hypothetical protein